MGAVRGGPTSLEPGLRRRVESVLEHRAVPGAAVGLVRNGTLEAFAGIGRADRGAGRPPAPDTLFRVASITKTFTATALMQLRDSGRLDLDEPLAAHVPEFASVAERRGSAKDVTLRRLLAHQSGLATE